MIDMINRGKLKLGKIDFCILDEADEMLNMGFLDEIESILEACNPERQMLCFSATMPNAIKRVAEKYMGEYNLIKVEAKQLTTRNTEQLRMHLRQSDKLQALTRVIDAEPEFYGIVFCKTKRGCDELVHALQTNAYSADAMHGDMNQKQRELALKKFRDKQTMLMIATDVAARGIDVEDLTHVVNYDMPQDAETYTHRIGRTGRAGKMGIALTFVTKKDERKIKGYERAIKSEIKKIEVPSIDSVIKLKKARITQQIIESLPKEESDEYKEIITQLLANHNEQQVIAGLLKVAFGKQLDTRNYSKITEVASSRERNNGQIRLFIARGRDSGIEGPRELVQRLQAES
jgi:ATP-dependent RNA helicase DeaD